MRRLLRTDSKSDMWTQPEIVTVILLACILVALIVRR